MSGLEEFQIIATRQLDITRVSSRNWMTLMSKFPGKNKKICTHKAVRGTRGNGAEIGGSQEW